MYKFKIKMFFFSFSAWKCLLLFMGALLYGNHLRGRKERKNDVHINNCVYKETENFGELIQFTEV